MSYLGYHIPDLYVGELLMLAVPEYEQLLSQMLEVNPAKHTTASEALERFRSLRTQIRALHCLTGMIRI